jgi:hypothetical protein
MGNVGHLLIALALSATFAASPAEALARRAPPSPDRKDPAMVAAALEARRAALAAAAREARREAARERQKRYADGWVRRWTGAYGSSVGRWADEAIGAGWPDGALWTLGRILRAESGGDPRARNSYSGCSGLLQLAPCHWRGKFDPFDPARNLAYGLKLYRGSGWRPWTTY